VIPQQELVEGLGDFRRNLTPERLRFVSPGSDHFADPDNLFRRLVASADRGVLLVGAAGTGKTRTSMEVGRRALDAGWRVLHVLPGEDASVTDQIAEEVFADTSPVLVVVDYLNESLLDLPALRHRLIPEAYRRGVSVALLASVRPGWLRKADRALLHELFDEVELRQDEEFQREVTDNAVTTVAPTAIRQLGMDRVLAVCGRRPIVALLIAQELERRVAAGLSIPETAGLRAGGELPAWLERRLREDGLAVAGREDTFHPARASSALVAAAAATAACPQPRREVTAAARATLDGASGHAPEADDVVATLLSLRWLESRESDGMLSVAHDVVTDQLVESVILPERDTAPDPSGTAELLAGCLSHPRTVGRFAVNIGRLVNDLALADRDGPVSPVLEGWFGRHAADIGRVMRTDADVGSYALGAICSGPPWSEAAVRNWPEAVTPWLTDFGTELNARHLLYRGLRHLPAEGAPLLVPTALAWLDRHRDTLNASFVLAPLLSRTDLTPTHAQHTITTAHTWLQTHHRRRIRPRTPPLPHRPHCRRRRRRHHHRPHLAPDPPHHHRRRIRPRTAPLPHRPHTNPRPTHHHHRPHLAPDPPHHHRRRIRPAAPGLPSRPLARRRPAVHRRRPHLGACLRPRGGRRFPPRGVAPAPPPGRDTGGPHRTARHLDQPACVGPELHIPEQVDPAQRAHEPDDLRGVARLGPDAYGQRRPPPPPVCGGPHRRSPHQACGGRQPLARRRRALSRLRRAAWRGLQRTRRAGHDHLQPRPELRNGSRRGANGRSHPEMAGAPVLDEPLGLRPS
jgi:hypothetical protein